MTVINIYSSQPHSNNAMQISRSSNNGAVNITQLAGSGTTFSAADAWRLHDWIEENVDPLPRRTVLAEYNDLDPGTRFWFGTSGYEYVKINDELVFCTSSGTVGETGRYSWATTDLDSVPLLILSKP
jgi:hypothetical protein